MKKNTRFFSLILLLFSPLAYSVVVDVNDVTVQDQGGGAFIYFWPLGGGTGISQLEPGESYVVDVEFLPGQSFNLLPNPVGDETIELAFGSDNGPVIIDPGLMLSSGSLEITGLIGDLDVPNPLALGPLAFAGNAGAVGEDFVIPAASGDLTSDGFSFDDLHFTFTFDNQGDIHPVNGGAFLAIVAGAPVVPVPVASDLWDLSQGTVVTSDSGVIEVSDIRNMFGGMFGPLGPYTIFEDYRPAGYIHSVEWQTAQPIELTSFNLFANHDHPPEFDANNRGFSAFRLFAQNPLTLNFELLAEVFPSNPYDDTPGNMASGGFLALSIDIAPTVAQAFRAEFVQYGGTTASGPRIRELDGFGTIPPVIGIGTEIDRGVSIGDNVNVGDFVLIKKDADIGDNVSVGSNTTINKDVIIGDNVMIGDNVVIDRNVVIEDGVTIGNDTTIKQGVHICSGATIGSMVTIGKNRRVDTGENVPDGIVWGGSKTPPPACTP
jgi:carbonic anhydrase/acetyltransferase-like protein (isoleucine patch superfamily)